MWEAGGEGLHGCRSPSLTEALTSGRSSSEPLPGETGDRRLWALPDVRQEIKTNSSELGLRGLGSKPPEAEGAGIKGMAGFICPRHALPRHMWLALIIDVSF